MISSVFIFIAKPLLWHRVTCLRYDCTYMRIVKPGITRAFLGSANNIFSFASQTGVFGSRSCIYDLRLRWSKSKSFSSQWNKQLLYWAFFYLGSYWGWFYGSQKLASTHAPFLAFRVWCKSNLLDKLSQVAIFLGGLGVLQDGVEEDLRLHLIPIGALGIHSNNGAKVQAWEVGLQCHPCLVGSLPGCWGLPLCDPGSSPSRAHGKIEEVVWGGFLGHNVMKMGSIAGLASATSSAICFILSKRMTTRVVSWNCTHKSKVALAQDHKIPGRTRGEMCKYIYVVTYPS